MNNSNTQFLIGISVMNDTPIYDSTNVISFIPHLSHSLLERIYYWILFMIYYSAQLPSLFLCVVVVFPVHLLKAASCLHQGPTISFIPLREAAV